jgi:hypothetical protein
MMRSDLLLGDLPIRTSLMMVDYVDVPARTHHRPRIQKKWLKRFGIRTIARPRRDAFLVAGQYYLMHPLTYAALKRQLAKPPAGMKPSPLPWLAEAKRRANAQ